MTFHLTRSLFDFSSHDTNEERYCAVTQFEACDAHRCFPCWDDPAIKATFDISLSVPKDRVALSNMVISCLIL